MDASLLKADCERCAALCCFALAFDPSDDFPVEKPNGVVCSHLGEGNHCKIYSEREQRGYRGCLNYECNGAGQRVTQEVFKGKTWRDDPALLREMTEAFVIMLRVQEQLVLLHAAAELPLTGAECDLFDQFMEELSPEGGWTDELLDAYNQSGFEKRLSKFLMSLRHHVA